MWPAESEAITYCWQSIIVVFLGSQEDSGH